MNILFLTLGKMDSIEIHALYPDLLRYFRNQQHNVYIMSAYEKRFTKQTVCIDEKGARILRVKVGNLTKCNIIEKGISTITLESRFKKAIKQYFSDVKFDLVMYSTPPITFCKAVEFVKKRDGAKTYLLLKDIFPQNAVDLGMMRKTGIKGLIYRYFRQKEKRLYDISDKIGCMSEANVDYVLKNNPQIDKNKVEVCPNSIEPVDMSVSTEVRNSLRKQYDIPLDKKVFVYGGNLGKPQGIPFLIDCLRSQKDNADAFFLIVGGGTEYGKLESYVESEKPSNVKLMARIPKEDYDRMVAACDVGMIFLDHRFTIPNFPSRLLAYMKAKLPVLAVTDANTDVGEVITEGGFGWWCESNDVSGFSDIVDLAMKDTDDKGDIAFEYLENNYSVKLGYEIIMKSIGE